MKDKYMEPEVLAVMLRTDTLMADSPVTGTLDPAPWELDDEEYYL